MGSVGAAVRAGSAFVELFADDSKLISGLRGAQSKLSAFGNDLLYMGLKLKALGALLAAPFIISTKIFSEMGDRLDAMSKRTGFSVEALSQLELATMLTDFSMKGMENALKRMQRTLVQMSLGTSQASRALGFLNLNTADIMKLKPEEQLGMIADALAAMSDKTQQAGAAMAIFGREATGLLPMLLRGSKGLLEFKKLADDFGLTIDSEVVNAADHFNDVIEIIRLQIKRLAYAVGEALEPALISVTEKIANAGGPLIKWAKTHGDAIRKVAKLALTVTALGAAIFVLGVSLMTLAHIVGTALIPLLIIHAVFSLITAVVTIITAVFSAFAGGIVAVLAPIALLVGAIVAIGAVVLGFSSVIKTAISRLDDLTDGTKKAINGVLDAMSAGDLELAAKILWTSVRLAFLVGWEDLKKTPFNIMELIIVGQSVAVEKAKSAIKDALKSESDRVHDVAMAKSRLDAARHADTILRASPPFDPEAEKEKARNAFMEDRKNRVLSTLKDIEHAEKSVKAAENDRMASIGRTLDLAKIVPFHSIAPLVDVAKTGDLDIATGVRISDLKSTVASHKKKLDEIRSERFESDVALFNAEKDFAKNRAMVHRDDIPAGPFDTKDSLMEMRDVFNLNRNLRIEAAQKNLIIASDALKESKKKPKFTRMFNWTKKQAASEKEAADETQEKAVADAQKRVDAAKKALHDIKKSPVFKADVTLKEAQIAFDLKRKEIIDGEIVKYERELARAEGKLSESKALGESQDVIQKQFDDIMKARAELDALIKEAKAVSKNLQIGGGPGALGNDAVKKAEDALNAAMSMMTAEVHGTFTNAQLLGRGGGDSPAERTARATEQIAENTDPKNDRDPEFGN